MGGFWSGLGNAMLDTAAANSPLANSVISRYRRDPSIQGSSSPQLSGPDMSQAMGPIPQPSLQTPATGLDPTSPVAQALQQGAGGEQIGNQSQWSQDPQSHGGGGGLAAIAGLAHGAIVTSPTIARIGESGPEAVVPLTPRAGNRLQPDLLEGHVVPKGVPGMRLSRYRSFNRFGRGGQSA